MRPGSPVQRSVAGALRAACMLVLTGSCLAPALVSAAPAPGVAPAFRQFGVGDGLPSAWVEALAQDQHGQLWLATRDGLARFDGQHVQVWRHQPGHAGSLPGNRVHAVAVEADGRVRVQVDGQGGWRLDPAQGRFSPAVDAAESPGDGLASHWADGGGGRWFVGAAGLAYQAPVPGEAAAHPGAAKWPAPAWEGPVTAFMRDREGRLWFGTAGQGLLALPADWRAFHLLGGGGVMSPAGPGAAWWSDAGGLWRLDLATAERAPVALPAGCPGQAASALLPLADGHLLVARGPSLARVSPGARPGCQVLPPAPWPVEALFEAADGALWLQGPDELARRGADGRASRHARGEGSWPGPDGQPWRRQGRRLQRWDPSTADFVAVAGAPAGAWRDLQAGPDGVAWLAAPDQLLRGRWRGGRFEVMGRWTPAEGLPAVEPLRLALDPRGVPWLATPRGLWRLDSDTGRFRRFGLDDGLRLSPLGEGAFYVAGNGIGVAAGAGHWQLFDTTRLAAARPHAPRLVFDGLRFEGSEGAVFEAGDTRLLRLGPGDRDLRVTARLVSFAVPGSQRFRFWMEGAEPGWVDTGPVGERVFPRLEPGHYTLQVQGAVAGGPWSASRRLSLLVDPPWWGTRAALAGAGLMALLALSLLVWAYRVRLRRREAWQLARARQQLAEQHSEAKTRFLATLGHEIRTPMTGVLGMAELLQSSPLDAEQRARVDAIQGAGRHLLRLVNDTLDLARIEAGKLVLEQAPFALRPLLDELAALLRPVAEAKGLAFHLRCDPDAPAALCGDATRVRQILLNLATNAIKFCERGELCVHVARGTPKGVRLQVRDTGPGVPVDQQERLFHRFEQGPAASGGRRYGGSGLGLAISQELAAAMGGCISVRSEPGRGAVFTVDLPLPEAPGAVVAPAPPVWRVPPRRVLLVEDDAVVAAVVKDLLAQQGHAVEHAAHGLAALAMLEDGVHDLALLDLDLPGLDGVELARLLRARGVSIPLLAITARADADAERQARSAGMQAFLRKPVTGAKLAQAIAGLTARAEAARPPP